LGVLARADSEWTPPLVLSDLVDPEAPFDAVADRIELLAGQMPLKLLGCVGLGDDPLRYRLAANLAARLARTGAQVTLVEAELHAPLLQPDRVRREGLVDMLLYGCSFTAVARESGIPGVRVVSAGSHLWSGEPIHGDEWERVLATLRGNSDFALITTTTGLPAPILGMLARRLDSIVIAYALDRASREAVRRSYLALWDMDAPILGLVTEGPHSAASPRPPAAGGTPAGPPARKPAETGPPSIGAEWASRLLGEPLAPGLSAMTEEVEVVIRQTSEVDAAAAALWEKEVERLRSILTAPDGVQPFLDAEAEPRPTADLDWMLSAPQSSLTQAPPPPPAPDSSAAMAANVDDAPPIDNSATEETPAEPAAGSEAGLDWGAAIGAEIAAWGTAVPPAVTPETETTPRGTPIRGLEHITIVAEDTFFAGASRPATPPSAPGGVEPPPVPESPESELESAPESPPASWTSSDVGEEPVARFEDAARELPADSGALRPEDPALPDPDFLPAYPTAPAPEPSLLELAPEPEFPPRTRAAEAAEEAASWFAQLDGRPAPSTPPVPSAPEQEAASDPLETLAIERSAPPLAPLAAPPDLPLAPAAPAGPHSLEPAAAEAIFPWNREEAAAEEDQAEEELWLGTERAAEPVAPRGTGRGSIAEHPSPRVGGAGPADLRIIEEIEEELVGVTAHAPSGVDDEPAPSRTPWRVLVIGGLVGLAAVGLWAYQSGMIRLEPPPPRSTAIIDETAEKAPVARPADSSAPPPAPSESQPEAPAAGLPATGQVTDPGAEEPASVATGADSKRPDAAHPTAQATGSSKPLEDRISTSDMGVGGGTPAILEPASGSVAAPVKAPPPAPKPTPVPAAAKPKTQPPATGPRASSAPAGRSEEAPPLDSGAVRVVGEMPVGFGVHVSSFRTEATAVNDLARFRTLGYPGVVVTVEVTGRGTWRRVVLGPYASASDAEDIAAAVRASGLSDKAQTMRLKP
jgi:hypothetical protein